MCLFKCKKKLFCCEHEKKDIVINDVIWDRITDNDDLEDIPTMIRVTYCKKCGKILTIQPEKTSFRYDESLEMNIPDYHESCLAEIHEFEDITGIDHRSVTLWKERKPLKKFGDIYKIN